MVDKVIARVKVIVTAAPTYLVGASIVVTAFSEEIGDAFPGAADEAVAVAAPILAGIAAAIGIIRRVTPVLAADRGLLPPDGE